MRKSPLPMIILILGGYGNFGKRLVKSLYLHHDHRLIIAGRRRQAAQQLCDDLAANNSQTARLQACELDALSGDLHAALCAYQPQLVINASGPYHLHHLQHLQHLAQSASLNYPIARACLKYGCHYIDLADNREFVCGFAALNAEAVAKKLLLVSGASTVPGLSCAVIDKFLPQFSHLHTIDYGIAPGNRTERGTATVAAILSYSGQPFTRLRNGRHATVHGWHDLRRHNFGAPLGKRWMSNCNIPDLTLLPQRYPKLQNVRFQAGLEVSVLHLGLWLLSGLTRIGAIKNLDRYARSLTKISDKFRRYGSDGGGMFMQLRGRDLRRQPLAIDWQLIAEAGSGPNVPTIFAEILVDKIARGDFTPAAAACIGLVTLDEFSRVAKRWGIYQRYCTPATHAAVFTP